MTCWQLNQALNKSPNLILYSARGTTWRIQSTKFYTLSSCQHQKMKNLPSAGPSILATKTSSTSICPQAPGAWLGGAARELLLQLVALWHLSSEADRPFHGCRLFLQFHYCLRNVIPNFAIWCRGERPKHGIQISLERWHWPWVDWGEIRSIGKLRSLWGDFANWFWRAPWNCFNWWPSWNITNITSIGNQAEMKWNKAKYGNTFLGLCNAVN